MSQTTEETMVSRFCKLERAAFRERNEGPATEEWLALVREQMQGDKALQVLKVVGSLDVYEVVFKSEASVCVLLALACACGA